MSYPPSHGGKEMTAFALSIRERAALEEIAANTKNAQEHYRANALLWLDDGESVQEIAERLRVSRQTVYNWAIRFQMYSNLDITPRLLDGERSGRPRTAQGIIDPLIGQVIDQDPREFGYKSTVWTALLLKEYLLSFHQIEVSRPSVSLALERLRIRWKRPRHQLARRPHSWRQAKGGSNVG
jgi:transposase